MQEQSRENLGPNDLAETLLQLLRAGAELSPALKQQLLEFLTPVTPSEPGISDDLRTAVEDTAGALEPFTAEKITLENIKPRNENEAIVLRAIELYKKYINKPNNQKLTEDECEEIERFEKELNMKQHEFGRATIDLLRDHGATIDIDDVKYFFKVLNRGEREYFISACSGMTGVPKGFSEGDLLKIRRQLITRYLDEIPEDDPYNSPRLWYLYLIRPDVYCYERGEDVRFIVYSAIKGHAYQEDARPARAAYVRGLLKDTLSNLDGEKAVVSKLNALHQKYPSPTYSIHFVHGEKGRGNFVVKRAKTTKINSDGTVVYLDYSDVVETIYPEKPMIASEYDVIR